MFNTTELN